MYMSRNDKNVMTSTNFDKTLKAISLFCLEHKGFNIKFYACAYVYLFLKYIYKHFSRGGGGISTKNKLSQNFFFLESYEDGKMGNALGLGQNGILVR